MQRLTSTQQREYFLFFEPRSPSGKLWQAHKRADSVRVGHCDAVCTVEQKMHDLQYSIDLREKDQSFSQATLDAWRSQLAENVARRSSLRSGETNVLGTVSDTLAAFVAVRDTVDAALLESDPSPGLDASILQQTGFSIEQHRQMIESCRPNTPAGVRAFSRDGRY